MSGTIGVTLEQSRSRTAGPVLPEDHVVSEILVRLSAKALLRCRAVCHSWHRRTSEAAFLLVHHRRQPSLPLVTFLAAASSSQSQHSHASLDTLDLRLPPLIGWTPLPRLADAALYLHGSSGECHILRCKRRRYGDHGLTTNAPAYHVLTIGSSAEPRRIELASNAPRASTWWFRCSERPGILLHGCLHWALHSSPEKLLMVFDTVTESFRSMPSPITGTQERTQLLEMDNTLAISWMDMCETTMRLWLLQDYETGVWTLSRRIIFPVTEMRSVLNVKWCRFYGTVVSQERYVLLHDSHSSYLFHCDGEGELVRKFCWSGAVPRPAGHIGSQRASSGMSSSEGNMVLVRGDNHVSFKASRV
ncbi:hypothetical protein QOZ80_6AG0533130 [Eleusine coracana subsp. coracana]|nr:hypothetical protein QOZ80_6AG0533130 [Eleusine coracana subsp. coracana]